MRALILTAGVSLLALGLSVVAWSLCVVAGRADDAMERWRRARDQRRR
jgi:hypothetical protein